MSWFSKNPSKLHKANHALSRLVVTACKREAIKARAFSIRDYALLPVFNWDVSAHEECAALHLIDEDVSILHVVSVLDNSTLLYRAKTLVPSPPSIVEFREALSISFVDDAGESWKSDCETVLEKVIAKVLSKESTLTRLLLSSGHSNVNAWLADFDAVSYMAVNTSKPYSSAEEAVEFIRISNEIINRLQDLLG